MGSPSETSLSREVIGTGGIWCSADDTAIVYVMCRTIFVVIGHVGARTAAHCSLESDYSAKNWREQMS